MLRKAVREALAANSTEVPAPAACSCQHDHHAPAASTQFGRETRETMHRGFKASPVLAAGGALLGILALLGMVTAALLAVALTALALAVVSVVLVLLVKMLQKELGR